MSISGNRSRAGRMSSLIVLLALGQPALGQFGVSRTYRYDSDFDEGNLLNVNHDSPFNNQLQLNATTTPFPYINVALSGRGTIARIDVNTGTVVGEYRTAPQGLGLDPSRTTVDLAGSVWCGNRAQNGDGSVVKVGLIIGGTRGTLVDGVFTPDPLGEYLAPPFQYNTCVDRNGDGHIRTSRGLGHILDWPDITDGPGGGPTIGPALVADAVDECELIYQRLPGAAQVRHVSVDANNDVWVAGLPGYVPSLFYQLNGNNGQVLDSFNAAAIGSGGYGGLVDGNGILWSASLNQNRLLRYDPATDTPMPIVVSTSYGLGIDTNGFLWNAMWSANTIVKVSPAGVIEPGFPKVTGGSNCRGVAVTPTDNNVWIANSGSHNVSRLNNDGVVRKLIPVGITPTGVAVDANGKVWVTNFSSNNVMRIDPDGGADGLGAIDLTVDLNFAGLGPPTPYNYSDMTGAVALGSTAPQGTWTIAFDSLTAGTDWGRVSWTSAEPEGTDVTVGVRAAESETDLSLLDFQPVANSVSFSGTGIVGRYIQMRVTLLRTPGTVNTPILYDLTVDSTSDFSDVTTELTIQYLNTTYNQATQTLQVQARARNVGTAPLDAPVLMIIDNIVNPSVIVLNPDGATPDGRPYFVFQAEGSLAPNAFTPVKTLLFQSPTGQPPIFTQSWQTPVNHPPMFTTFPTTTAAVGMPYQYNAIAVDADGDPVTYALDVAPIGMSLGAAGEISWTPAADELGGHSVQVRATDDGAATTTQAFTVNVLADLPNRPPVFLSAPITHASVGAAYAYQAAATDPDADPLTFSKLAGPTDLTVSPSGSVEWGFALPGNDPVGIRVTDGAGGQADQTYTLTVGAPPANPNAPLLIGTPTTIAAVGLPYMYQPSATDPDAGQTLAFSLPTMPAGMSINPMTGLVTWTPSAGQVGMQSVVLAVTDGSGAATTQAWSIQVFATPLNLPPVITTIPNLIASVGAAYQYDVTATDPEGGAITYSLIMPPAGMTIVPTTGVIDWVPAAAGPVTVAVRATDPQGSFGSQVFILNVSPPNVAPMITSTAVLAATIGATYHYDVDATDANGHAITYALTTAPQGMFINAMTGIIQWTPTATQAGPHPVTVTASDAYGGSATQNFTVTAGPDTTPPGVLITVTPTPAHVNEAVQICVQAGDNVSVIERTLTIDGNEQALNAFFCTSYTPSAIGIVPLAATATDGAENVGMASLNLQVVDPNDVLAPVVTIVSPAAGTLVTAPTDIVASITDDTPRTLVWEVRRYHMDSSEFTLLASGVGEFAEGVIASLDPTLLSNDNYTIEVFASDGQHTASVQSEVGVTGDFKLGNFSISFTDLTIPLAGIPIAVTRSYNSLDTSKGDFGAGWRLGLAGSVSDTAAEAQPLDEAFTFATRVYVTRPDGRRVGFKFTPQSFGFPFSFFMIPGFTPDPGVTDKLETSSLSIFPSPSGFLVFPFGSFNPSTYLFTTKEQIKYTLDEQVGLVLIEDINGNTITVTPQGLVSSTGVSVAFQRDAAGRIIRITEPDEPADPNPPGELDYVYDATGNLIAFRNQMDHQTEYFYENPQPPRYLTRIEDPMNTPVIRTVYDQDGRLIALCNQDGDINTLEGCSTLSLDPGQQLQTILNARGFRSDLILDERGNVLIERRYLDNTNFLETVRTFDADDNMLTETDPELNMVSMTYDDRGNVLTRTDAGGRTSTYTYNDCNQITSVIDPMGNATNYTYDADCNLRFINDALGGVTEYQYDALGRMTHLIDPAGSTWQFFYDAAGRPSAVVDPLGHTASTQYNMAGELVTAVDRNGRQIDFVYDALHRVMTETWDTVPPRVTSYSYNAVGFLSGISDPDSTLSIDYWPTGLLRSVENAGTPGAPPVVITYGYADGAQVVAGYDGNGNRTHVTDSLGGLTEYLHDGLDRPAGIRQYAATDPHPGSGDADGDGDVDLADAAAFASVLSGPATDCTSCAFADFDGDGDADLLDGAGFQTAFTGMLFGGAVTPKRVDFVYSPASLVTSIHRYADLAGTVPVANTLIGYDCGGCPLRTTSIHHRRASDNGVLLDLDLVRDALGNVTSVVDGQGAHAYSYDGLSRLLSAMHPGGGVQPNESYSYDAAGNRVASHLSPVHVYSYALGEGGNQLRQDSQYTYEYDGNGSLIRRTETATGDYLELDYDHRKRLVEAVAYDAANTPQHTASFVYDGLGRRIRAEIDGVVTHYVYDGDHPILTLDASLAVTHRRLYARTLDHVLADQTAGQTHWLLTDQVGSVRLHVDDGAASQGGFVYDSFGRVLNTSGLPADGQLRLHAREFGDFTGLGYFRARYYDPRIGRFLAEDANDPYAYMFVGNGPLTFVDPNGRTAAFGAYAKVLCSVLFNLKSAFQLIEPQIRLYQAIAEVYAGGPLSVLEEPLGEIGRGPNVPRQFFEQLADEIICEFIAAGASGGF